MTTVIGDRDAATATATTTDVADNCNDLTHSEKDNTTAQWCNDVAAIVAIAMCKEPNRSEAFFQNVSCRCKDLFERDYVVKVINNTTLCPTYPAHLFFLKGEKKATDVILCPNNVEGGNMEEETEGEELNLNELMCNAEYARCRKRLPCPVIYFNNKHICRSATLSIPQEVYGRPYLETISSFYNYLLGGVTGNEAKKDEGTADITDSEDVSECSDNTDAKTDADDDVVSSLSSSVNEQNNRDDNDDEDGDENEVEEEKTKEDSENGDKGGDEGDADNKVADDEDDVEIIDFDNEEEEDMHLLQTKASCDTVQKYRQGDIRLLQALGVKVVFDLMVENKKFKYLFYVSTSEKVMGNMYTEFNLAVMPYPGVELFHNADTDAFDSNNVKHDWDTPEFDAEGSVAHVPALGIDFSLYKEWSLRQITDNYLRLLIHYAGEKNSDGILIHCISGWDRTPLFTSLMRITLWADGLVHTSLSAEEMLYLTVAYDWVLFGHQLHTRMKKKENIFFFNFDYLQFIVGEEFACGLAPNKSLRRGRLTELRQLFMDMYSSAKSMVEEKQRRATSGGWIGWLWS
eukprot:m.106137 g.106137  ORF g.106137 m.106137 type:complete len:573 (+) comp12669_c0_seq1:208-1926(+)